VGLGSPVCRRFPSKPRFALQNQISEIFARLMPDFAHFVLKLLIFEVDHAVNEGPNLVSKLEYAVIKGPNLVSKVDYAVIKGPNFVSKVNHAVIKGEIAVIPGSCRG